MSWLDFLRRPADLPMQPPPAIEIPIFPLGGVLFPGGVMSLKVFEQRYLDMAAHCMKNETPFGVCLIASGKEVADPATPHPVGTLAHIERGDMEQLGILMLGVRGGRRFRIVSRRQQADGLQYAQVTLLDEPPPRAVPPAQQALLPLLKKIASDLGSDKMPLPHAFDDATWVGYRLTEVVPVQALAKQKLLELDDPISRLEILFTYLAQRKLVS